MNLFRLALFVVPVEILLAQGPSSRLCETVVGLFPVDFQYKIRGSDLARVEVRQCFANPSETIQLVAWSARAKRPDLVVDTTDFVVVASAIRANIVFVETGGAARDQVFVIVYEHGTPRLSIRRSTKGSASITISPNMMHLVIPDIYTGDSPPGRQEFNFNLDPEGIKVP